MHQIEWTEYSKDGYDNLDGNQNFFVDKAIKRIKFHGMNAGQLLHSALPQCNKLKITKWDFAALFLEKYKVKLK